MTVATWNMLAQCYVSISPPPHLDPSDLQPKRRRALTRSVLGALAADVLCLQEVDDYHSYWKGQFEHLGFAASLYAGRKRKREGLCLAYARGVTMLRYFVLDLDGVAEFTEPALRRHVSRRCVAQFALLLLENGREVLVCNTHLYWDPAATDVKVLQAHYVVKELAKVLEVLKRSAEKLPIVFCGDFNSLPGGAVLTLLETGNLPKTHREFALHCCKYFNDFDFAIPLHFARVAHPFYTNYVGHFKGCIDHVLHSPGVRCVRVDVVGTDGGRKYVAGDGDADEKGDAAALYPVLPSSVWPSDHLAIVARLCLGE